jgi:hypothetical protein
LRTITPQLAHAGAETQPYLSAFALRSAHAVPSAPLWPSAASHMFGGRCDFDRGRAQNRQSWRSHLSMLQSGSAHDQDGRRRRL